MKIEIDNNSGFCFGVVKAIEIAETELEKDLKLYCLGDIVHNDEEVKRLEKKGLITINHEQLKKLKNTKVLLRAHGEPPETYEIAKQNNITLIDASCPIVLNLQKKIHKSYYEISKIEGQIIIYGKQGHAEVIGLLGHTNNKGIVISEVKDLNKINFRKPISIFSQTTKSSSGYKKIIKAIKQKMIEVQGNDNINFISHASTCGQVSTRDIHLVGFAKKHDIIIFVSGKKSSNGKLLYEVSKKENENTYFVSNTNELKKEWFKQTDSVGICGATSTPEWLMKNIKKEIESFDIYQEKQIEKNIQQSIEKFETVFDFINDTVTINDFSGKMLSVNNAFCKRLGYTRAEALQLKLEDFDANENSNKFIDRVKTIKNNGYVVYETLNICKDGSKYYTEFSSKIIDFDGKKAILGIGRDISKRKQIVKELNKAKEQAETSAKMQASFLANMSHEIRTPMNGIIGFTDLLRNNDLKNEKREEYIDIIQNSGKHLLNLINDIIDISKIDSRQVKLFEKECKINFCLLDISNFFNKIIKEKSENKVQLIINYGIPVGEDTIIADETKLKQILINLIGNAVKFTKNGTITVDASFQKENYILFSVKDTGIGITKESQSLIFERFRQADESTTRNYGGTGLGLAISKAYVEMMGGKIWIESDIGKGSTFYFTVKYNKPKAS